MRRVRLAAVAIGALGLVAGLAFAFWPLNANGVSGNAVTPHYRAFQFGVYASSPLPPNPSRGYLRSLGVRLPQDVVADRRQAAAWTAGVGAALGLVGFLSLRRRQS